jgi:hypothetical protein
MKKFVSKFLCLLLCFVVSLSLVACKPNENEGGYNDENVTNSSDAYDEFIDTYV